MKEKQVLGAALLLTAALTLFIFFILLSTPQPDVRKMPDQDQIVAGYEINYYAGVGMKILIGLSILGMAFLSLFACTHKPKPAGRSQ